VGDRELAVIPQPESALYCVKRAGRGFACGTRGYGIVPRSAALEKHVIEPIIEIGRFARPIFDRVNPDVDSDQNDF
jgi:hypothetical protein